LIQALVAEAACRDRRAVERGCEQRPTGSTSSSTRQSIGQIEFAIADLGVDFIGFSLHKWIGDRLVAGIRDVARG
jgi:hypothetical protein